MKISIFSCWDRRAWLHSRSIVLLQTCLWALMVVAAAAAPPRLEQMFSGQWPEYARGDATDVVVVGNRAYVAFGYGGLLILDISNPANPVRLGGCETGGYARSVAVSGTVAYVADDWKGLQIIDVSHPASPVRLARYDMEMAWSVAVSGTVACVADYGVARELRIIDVSNPSHPVGLSSFATAYPAVAVAVSGTVAYVAEALYTDEGGNTATDGCLEIIDISNPSSPRLLSSPVGGAVLSVAVSGTVAYVTSEWYHPWPIFDSLRS